MCPFVKFDIDGAGRKACEKVQSVATVAAIPDSSAAVSQEDPKCSDCSSVAGGAHENILQEPPPVQEGDINISNKINNLHTSNFGLEKEEPPSKVASCKRVHPPLHRYSRYVPLEMHTSSSSRRTPQVQSVATVAASPKEIDRTTVWVPRIPHTFCSNCRGARICAELSAWHARLNETNRQLRVGEIDEAAYQQLRQMRVACTHVQWTPERVLMGQVKEAFTAAQDAPVPDTSQFSSEAFQARPLRLCLRCAHYHFGRGYCSEYGQVGKLPTDQLSKPSRCMRWERRL